MTALVVDASAVVDLLLGDTLGELVGKHLDAELVTVAHLDADVFSALARLFRSGAASADAVSARLRLLATMDLTRLPITGPLLEDAWDLRHNITARDALYVALARGQRVKLLTTDRRLARAVPDVAVELD